MDQTEVQERARLHAIRELFELEGWKEIIRDLVDEIDTEKERIVLHGKTLEDLYFSKGKIAQMLNLIHLEDTIDNLLNAGAAEENADV